MPTSRKILDLSKLEGYRWLPTGQSALAGPTLERFQSLERLFLGWAATVKAQEHRVPSVISAEQLKKVDYFRSFPHLMTLPATLAPDGENLRRFTASEPVDAQGRLRETAFAPVRDVLTPAACYHFYVLFQDAVLDRPQLLTTCATCFRWERQFVPLQRQWSFSMREIVVLGTPDEVETFAGRFRERIQRWCESAKLPVEWKTATDPFFNPKKNPKALMQQLESVKTELVFDGKLAIGSINRHGDYFGEAFNIRRKKEPVHSACVAFGVERWLFALLTQFGVRRTDWPLSLRR